MNVIEGVIFQIEILVIALPDFISLSVVVNIDKIRSTGEVWK